MPSTARVLFGGMLACAVSLGLGRFAFTPILPAMQGEFGLDAQAGGWMAAWNNAGYLAGALWAARATTDAQRHRMLGLGFAAMALSLLLMPLTADMVLWSGLRALAGLASALIFVLGGALVVQHLIQTGHGRWTGFHFSGVGVGIVLSGLVIGRVADGWGSSAAWLLTGLLCGAMGGGAWPVLRRLHPASSPARPTRPVPFPLGLLAAAYFLAGFGYIVTGTFLVVVIRATPGLESWAGWAWVLVGLAAIPSSAGWSWLAEHKGHARALMAAHLIEALGVALPALSSHPAAVLLGAVLYGATFLGVVGMAFAFGRAITPDNPSRTLALLTALFGVGQIIAPVLAALIAARHGWGWALLMASAALLAGAPLLLAGAWREERRRRRQPNPARTSN